MVKKSTPKSTPPPLPECWIDQQPTQSRKRIYGIWAKYNKATRTEIEKECGLKAKDKVKETKRKDIKKSTGSKGRTGKGKGKGK